MAEWYAVKLRPGTQRAAKPRVGEPEDRKGEFIIERSLRDAGFDIFMPSMRKEVRHHRTNEFMERRFALLIGYVFVKLASPDPNFFALSRCDGVTAILGAAGRPMVIPTQHINALITAEDEADEHFERQRGIRLAKASRPTKRQLEEMHPKGTPIVISPAHKLLGGLGATVLGATGRNTLRVMMSTLGSLVPVEIDAAEVEKVA